MMGAVGRWLMAVIAVALLCAAADALMPQGAVRRVGKLVCGLVLLGAVLSPVADLDAEGGRRWLDGCLSGLDSREEELEETVNSQMKTIIEQRCAAYIVDKAGQLGLTCTARVVCEASEDGLYLPVRTEVAGLRTAGEQEKLIRVIERDLGVPAEGQFYAEEEEKP